MRHIALIGCGGIGQRHAKNLAGQAQLSFCSRSQQSAADFAARFGGKALPNIEAVWTDRDIEAVVICSPPEHHCQQVVAALTAGKSVLVEKPMCITPDQIETIGQALDRADGAFLMVAENYYYKPSLMAIRQLLDQGAIGQLRQAKIGKVFTQPATGWKEGYGALLEGGIHFVALVSALFKDAPLRVEARFPGHSPGQSERHSVLQLTYPDNVEVQLDYAWNQPSWSKGLLQHNHIIGTEGTIGFECNGLYLWTSGRAGPSLRLPGFGDLMGYGAMTAEFLACLSDPSKVPYSDFERAKRDLTIVFTAYQNL